MCHEKGIYLKDVTSLFELNEPTSSPRKFKGISFFEKTSYNSSDISIENQPISAEPYDYPDNEPNLSKTKFSISLPP